jgi:hypothetical protein
MLYLRRKNALRGRGAVHCVLALTTGARYLRLGAAASREDGTTREFGRSALGVNGDVMQRRWASARNGPFPTAGRDVAAWSHSFHISRSTPASDKTHEITSRRCVVQYSSPRRRRSLLAAAAAAARAAHVTFNFLKMYTLKTQFKLINK